nr:MAG TPA_asm: hypothetical protein [Caudoviricetes sp.]DAZ61740.1 MAG TPA: hypothetical protein [Caudoviricetes sp.]
MPAQRNLGMVYFLFMLAFCLEICYCKVTPNSIADSGK